jgi:putative RecB family exonuclease
MANPVLRLSPSSARDFKSCPQLFKFRAIDRLPEPVSGLAARGFLVHSVLEGLFGEEPGNRTPQRAAELLDGMWAAMRTESASRPEGLTEVSEGAWLGEARRLLANYFKLEDPRTLAAIRLEWQVGYELSELHLRGVIDRLEEVEDGSWILTDYKTGKLPAETRELTAFFGLRFYALVCWRAFGVLPKQIRLVYLSDPAVLTLIPNERMLAAFERQMRALAIAVQRAHTANDWRPRPSPFCMSCAFQSICPAWSQSADHRADRSQP